MAIHVWLKSALVVLGIVSLAAAEAPFTAAFNPSQSPAFSSNVIDVKTEPGTTTIESPEVRRLGDHTFVVGKLVTHATLARAQVAGTRIWIPISEVLEIIEHEKTEKPRPAGTTVNPVPESRVEVESGGTWWPAEIVERKDGKYRIHYTGWSDTYDEWITVERMRLVALTSNVEVEWGGTWWAAEIVERKDGKYRIHYVGYGEESDEWVTRDRIRLKKVEGGAAETK